MRTHPVSHSPQLDPLETRVLFSTYLYNSLADAFNLGESILELFASKEGSFYSTSRFNEALLLRHREGHDGASRDRTDAWNGAQAACLCPGPWRPRPTWTPRALSMSHASVAPAVSRNYFPAHGCSVASVANVRGTKPKGILLRGPVKVRDVHFCRVPMRPKNLRFFVFKTTKHFVRSGDAVQICRPSGQRCKTLGLALRSQCRPKQQ